MLPTATGERILFINRHEAGAAMTDEIHLRHLEAFAEAAYDKMYDAGSPSGATALYSDAKEALADAIGLARRLRRAEDVRTGSRTSRLCLGHSSPNLDRGGSGGRAPVDFFWDKLR
jgi:hypothetical protein